MRFVYLGSQFRPPASFPPRLTTTQLPSTYGWCHQPPQGTHTPKLLIMLSALPRPGRLPPRRGTISRSHPTVRTERAESQAFGQSWRENAHRGGQACLLSHFLVSVGVERVALRSHPMPRAAVEAALDTYALVLRERHPGVVAVPLRDVGSNGAVLAPAAGQVIRPFAAPEKPEKRQPALDWNASVSPFDYRRASRGTKNEAAREDR
jgi:hypothetical protein